VSSERVTLGLFGLLLDARYGLVPYVPALLLAPAGLVLLARRRAPLLWMLFPAVVYYATVASANNWAGSICNLGRFMLVLVPLAAVAAGVAWQHAAANPGRRAVALALASWSLLLSYGLWHDPAGANDCALFLLGSAYADGNVYIPNLWLPGWGSGAPGLFLRIAAWIGATVLLTAWLLRANRGRGGGVRAVAGLLGVVLGTALLLERMAVFRDAPVRDEALAVGRRATAFVADGAVVHRATNAVARSGTVRWLVRSADGAPSLPLVVFGRGYARAGSAYVELKPAGVGIDLPLEPIVRLRGRGGVEESLMRGALRLETESEVSLEIRR
jgi:hypothetical protein